MAVGKIVQIDGVVALTIPEPLLEQIGLTVGDEANVEIVNNQIIVASVPQQAHSEKVMKAAQNLIKRRSEVYAALAEND